jgi:hypothetical protein
MNPEAATPARLTVAQGLAILAGAIVLSAGFLMLQFALGLATAPLGFFFALYWGGIEQSRADRWAPCTIGGLFGIALAFAFATLTQTLGPMQGLMVFMGIILVVVFVLIMNWLPLIINLPSMLFLTIACYPGVFEHANFLEMAANLTVSAVYFGAVTLGAKALLSKVQKPASATA